MLPIERQMADELKVIEGVKSSFGDLLSLLTHDINNMLSRLMILSDQLSDPQLAKAADEKFQKTVNDIASTMRNVTDLINERSDKLEEIFLEDLVERALKISKRRLDQRAIVLELKISNANYQCRAPLLIFALSRFLIQSSRILPEKAKLVLEATEKNGRVQIALKSDSDASLPEVQSGDFLIAESAAKLCGGRFMLNAGKGYNAVLEFEAK